MKDVLMSADVADSLVPTTLGDQPGAIAVDKARVRAVDDGGIPAVWVPVVSRSPEPLQDPEAKILATRYAKRVKRVEGGIVRTVGPVPDDGLLDPTRAGEASEEARMTGQATVDEYLQLAAAMNQKGAAKGHVLFCLVRSNEAAD